MATRTDLRERAERRARILAEVIASDRAALCRQAARSARRPEDAEDALQDACAEFLRYYEGPPGERALRYLMVSVRRRACALCARAAAASQGEVEFTTTDFLMRGESRVAVHCERPGPAERSERTALLLLGLGCSYREIGELRCWSARKVDRCLVEGCAALRPLDKGGRDSAVEPLER